MSDHSADNPLTDAARPHHLRPGEKRPVGEQTGDRATETALVEDGRQIAHTLSALRQLGIKIAMDDFGTGYSSLAHLRDLPLDRIKIDRSFVAAALGDKHSMAVVKAITQMGRDMNIQTIAEGVEEADQLALLKLLGCDAVQGYLIGRPERCSVSSTPLMEANHAA